MCELAANYAWPSEAFWRYFELKALRGLRLQKPILEIGCGDGRFSALLFDQIEEALDINPKAVERARACGLYRQVRCADARKSTAARGNFATVYANCVMEHIPGIEAVLSGCYNALAPEGQLVMTVPLPEMNRHLLFGSKVYSRWRQQQLAHCNLFAAERWRELLQNAGFREIEFRPYLGAAACRFWDQVDVIGCLGWRRFTVASALSVLSRPLRRSHAKRDLVRIVARWLAKHFGLNDALSLPCATLIVARK
jgi:SAM-dependent methyltransferase